MRKYQLPLKTNACQTNLNVSLQASVPGKEVRLVTLLSDPLNDSSSSASLGHQTYLRSESSPQPSQNGSKNELAISGIGVNKSFREHSSVKKKSVKERLAAKEGHRSLQKYVVLNLDREEAPSLDQSGSQANNLSSTEVSRLHTLEEPSEERARQTFTLSSPTSAQLGQNLPAANGGKFIKVSKAQPKGSPARGGSEANTLSRDNHLTPSRRRSFRAEEQVFYEPKPGGETEQEAVALEDFCVNHPSKRAKYTSIAPHQKFMKEGTPNCSLCSKCAIDIALRGVRVFEKVSSSDASESGFKTTHLEIHSIDQIRDSDSGSIITTYPLSQVKRPNGKEEVSRRELEIKGFLDRLEGIRKSTWKTNQSLDRNKRDIKNFYEKQVRQVEEMIKGAQDVLERKKEQVIEKLFEAQKETFSKLGKCESSLTATRRDLENIIGDIVSNMEKILKYMDEEPFKMILLKYKERVDSFEKYFVEVTTIPFQLSKVAFTCEKNEDKQLEEEVLKNVSSFFEINNFEILLQDAGEDEFPKFPKVDLSPTVISFNNKEIFENALKVSLDKMKLELQKGSSINEEKSGREVLDVLYDVSNITEIKRYSSPFYDRSFLSDKSQRVSITNKSVVENSFLNQKEDKENETPRVGIRSNNSKYINLLEKISHTQENTSRLYNNIIKNNPALSPEVFKEKKLSFTPVKLSAAAETSEISNKEQIRLAQVLLDDNNEEILAGAERPGKPLAQDSSRASLSSEPLPLVDGTSEGRRRGELKGLGNFMEFIENKINDDRKIMFNNANYQKNLFQAETSTE